MISHLYVLFRLISYRKKKSTNWWLIFVLSYAGGSTHVTNLFSVWKTAQCYFLLLPLFTFLKYSFAKFFNFNMMSSHLNYEVYRSVSNHIYCWRSHPIYTPVSGYIALLFLAFWQYFWWWWWWWWWLGYMSPLKFFHRLPSLPLTPNIFVCFWIHFCSVFVCCMYVI